MSWYNENVKFYEIKKYWIGVVSSDMFIIKFVKTSQLVQMKGGTGKLVSSFHT
jgi:hypothetical protein